MDALDEVVVKMRDWPAARRAEAAELLLALDDLGTGPAVVDDDTLAAIDEALAQIARGERAVPGEATKPEQEAIRAHAQS